MKSYVPCHGLELAVLVPKWISAVDDIEEDLLRNNSDEPKVMMVHADVVKSNLSWLPKPWLLKGEAANEYWQHVFNWWMEDEEKKHTGIPIPPKPEMLPEIEGMIEEDKQFWNFKDDIRPENEGEVPQWKYSHPRMQELFDWLLWGKPGSFHEIQVSMAQLTEPDDDEVQELGKAHVVIIEEGGIVQLENWNQPGNRKLLWSLDFPIFYQMIQASYNQERQASPIQMAESDNDAAWELDETYEAIVQDEETIWSEKGVWPVDRRLSQSFDFPIIYHAAQGLNEQEGQALPISLADLDNNEIQILGEPQVHLIGTSQDDDASNERVKQLLADKKSVVLIVEGKVNTDESEGTVFYSNMSGGFHCGNGCGNWKGANSSRGGTPLAPPPSYMAMPPHPGPPAWGQRPWQEMPYYPLYMLIPSPSMPRTFSPEEYPSGLSHIPDNFRLPSPPKGPHADYSKSGQKHHYFETKQEDARCEVRKDCSPLPSHEHSKVGADRVVHHSPSLDIKEVFDVEEEVEMEPLVIIDVPMLGSSLAFTPEALRNWGQAHEDHLEQTLQFCTQLHEWKRTKQDLHMILGKD